MMKCDEETQAKGQTVLEGNMRLQKQMKKLRAPIGR